MKVYFHPKGFNQNLSWFPYYKAYKGHKFQVTRLYKGGHIGLVCILDLTVIVRGWVHGNELMRA